MKIKAGLEIHIQLDTKEKLFCKCKTTMKEEIPKKIIKRKLHPVAGEFGIVDLAAQYEYLRDREFYYEYFENESCLIELDEEPPREINKEALTYALQIAMMLNCKIPDRIQIMRKTVIDGSNTSGFQRTALIGFDGYIDVDNKKIEIKTVCLEEDACAIDKEENGKVYYKLNRLGIPLVEISTGIFEVENFKEIEEVAFNIGWLVKTIKKIKRGIGSIRQDVNISINSTRIELKGIQRLEDISKVVNYEVRRLLDLEKLVKEFKNREVKISDILILTDKFKNSKSKLIEKFLKEGNEIYGLILYNFKDFINFKIADRTLAKEIADYLKAFNSGIIHSEENLEKYNLKEDFEKIREELKIGNEDVLAIFASKNDIPIKFIKQKIEKLINGILENETRKANSDLSTSFLRPLPGSARMYPETDLPLISISRDFLEQIKISSTPLNIIINQLSQKYNVDKNVLKEIARKDLLDFCQEILDRNKNLNPNFVFQIFLNFEKYNLDKEIVEKKRDDFYLMFKYLEERKISKAAIDDILKEIKEKSLEEIIKEKDLIAFNKDELKSILEKMNIKDKKDLRKLFENEKIKKKIIFEMIDELLG
ncbi:MAG: Glu-tRNA(Gln) amidotransferase subunit GatE [Candidatus Aenigmatarchaeota archaeon]|nr:Glu-tRNA(Gln) amidotransferase subunit GatE [Candidatus Aenigmarchaeota archaeon]